MKWTILVTVLFYLVEVSLAGFCKQSYSCTGTCYKQDRYTTKCGFAGWKRCTRYRQGSYSCGKTCYRDVCCSGFQGSGCNQPICFGSTRCPNGGRCVSPNSCSCPTGFSSPRCNDIDECSTGASRCKQVCTNTHGSYTCSCNAGYRLLSDGWSCFDIDECSQSNGECQQKCVNQQGTYKCDCNSGYKLNTDSKTCSDVDECSSGTSGCQRGCVNTDGSFKCTCPTGYTLALDGKACEDVDECAKDSSICMHFCENTDGSYKCTCQEGYTLSSDGKTCKEVDKCAINNGGCEQICTSEFGNLKCSCRHGYVLNSDQQTCSDVDECSRAGPPVCDHTCTNTDGSYMCSCSPGFTLSSDKRTCINIDDCVGVNCQNGGKCLDDINKYSCLCEQGFTGTHCEADIDECLTLNGGCEDICENNFGSFNCSCEGDRTLNTDGLTCSGELVTPDVFKRNSIFGRLLPTGCHYIDLFQCPVGNKLNVRLSSTSRWYQVQTDNKIAATPGIVFMEANKFEMPFSITGAEVYRVRSNFSLTYKVNKDHTLNTSYPIDTVKPDNCYSLNFTHKDILDFLKEASFLKSLFKGLFKKLPDWLKLDKVDGSAVKIQDLTTDIVYGSQIDSIRECKGAPVFPDRPYSVFLLGSEFSLSLYGNDIKMPKLLQNTKLCMIVDICNDNGGAVFMMFPEESRDVLMKLDVFQNLQTTSNLRIRLRGIGVSLAKEVNVQYNQAKLVLWNGDRMFQYNLPNRANLWIGGDFIFKPDNLDVEGSLDMYASIPRFDKILKAVFYDEWNALVRLKSTAGVNFKMKIFGKNYNVSIPVGRAYLDAYLSIGGQKQRRWCGDLSNPPGAFLATRAEVNPFRNVPILKDWVLDVSVEVHAFFMTDPGSKVTPDFKIDILNDIIGIKNITEHAKELLLQLKELVDSFVSSSLNIVFNAVMERIPLVLNAVNEILQAIEENKFKDIPNILSDLWSNVSNFDQLLTDLKAELEDLKNATVIAVKDFIKLELRDLKQRVSNVINKLKSQITSALKNFSGVGVKFRVDLTLLFLRFGAVDVEAVYSTEELMKCSRFDRIRELMKGKKALRALFRLVNKQNLGFFIKAEAGIGLGLALSTEEKDWALQFNAYINILGMKATGDIFITQKGLSVYIEGNVWDVFYAQLDVHAGIGKNWYELEYSVSGKFVTNARKKRQTQAVTKSFQGSYLDGLRKVISNIADGAQKRLTQAQNALTSFQQKLSNAQDWFDKKKQNVRDANKAFDRAVRSFDKAKDKLEAAKGPFRRAIEKLSSAQRKVDRLCKIKTCNKLCVPGVKCKICKKKVGWVKVPYPCCRFTKCMIRVPNPICVLANAGCYVIRKLAYAALEAAKLFVRVPMLALDAAKLAVSAAQVIVDKSRIVLKVAEGALEVAKLSLEAVKLGLEGAKAALEGIKFAIGAAAKVLDFVIRYGLQSIVDVRNCGFFVKLSTVDLAIFDVSCEVNAFKLGWRTIRIRINFKNILQSIWNAAKATIKTLIKEVKGIFSGRRKREIDFDLSSKLHSVIRRIREADSPLNSNFTDLNETIDVSENTWGFEKEENSDYEHRTRLFAVKCKTVSRHLAFLSDTLETLNEISTEAKSSLDLASQVSSEIDEQSSFKSGMNFTPESIGIDVDYAKHYNLTEEDILEALKNAEPEIDSNPELQEIRNMSQFSQRMIDDEIESFDFEQITAMWIQVLENVTKNHFNESECVDFRDCVLYSISSLYDIFSVDEHTNISRVRSVLSELEDDVLILTQNTTYDITGIYNTTTAIKENLRRLTDWNIYCAKPPAFVSDLQNVTTELHGSASFYCGVQPDADMNFWWYRGDQLIDDEHARILTKTNVTMTDEPYRCVAGNVVANMTSNDAYILLISSVNETDPCMIDNGGCEHACINVNGTAQCSCNSGFVMLPDLRSCVDLDECQADKDDCEQVCVNTVGSYMCSCEDGFNMTDNKCIKVKDACESMGLNCSQTTGCKEGGIGGAACFCKEGYQLDQSGTQCEDINECEQAIPVCDQGCRNTDGGYRCFCNTGFYMEDDTCVECEYPTWGDNCSQTCDCVASTKCDPVKGCICEAGWRGTKCDQDIDECTESPGICNDTMKECINEDGFFSCVCNVGYTESKNGTCEDVKECSQNPNPCEQLCIEKDGSYECACQRGFSLNDDGKSCIYDCVSDCAGQPIGDYPSCITRHGYVSCVWGIPFERQCPSVLIWDDELKRCEWPDAVGNRYILS